MKKLIYLPILLFAALGIAQENQAAFKKRVLETTEVDFLTSYYTQDGNNASVTGGIGTEKLSDFTPTIVISMPLNADDVLTIDAGISAYTSASSSNLNRLILVELHEMVVVTTTMKMMITEMRQGML